MPIEKPFFRCVRPGVDGQYQLSGRWMYILDPHYSSDATHYLRAFRILQNDLIRLFEYVEPADINEETFSYRCLELLIRACGEFEANCKAIFSANDHVVDGRATMDDYRLLNPTHHLSSYLVRLPVWTGQHSVRRPFAAWEEGKSPSWFKAHHGGKHNRHDEFPSANFGNVIDAVAGVVAIIAAQFLTHDYGPESLYLAMEGGPSDGFEHAIGNYFEVKFPDDWSDDDCYEFNWQELKKEPDPIQKIVFPS